jgi:hypothetical protein
MIDQNDSGEDCVYVYTKSPNIDNFPMKVTTDNNDEIKSKGSKQFLDVLNFERVRVKTCDGDIYYLFDKGVGISLV